MWSARNNTPQYFPVSDKRATNICLQRCRSLREKYYQISNYKKIRRWFRAVRGLLLYYERHRGIVTTKYSSNLLLSDAWRDIAPCLANKTDLWAHASDDDVIMNSNCLGSRFIAPPFFERRFYWVLFSSPLLHGGVSVPLSLLLYLNSKKSSSRRI